MLTLFGRPTFRLAAVAFLTLMFQTTLCADLKPLGATVDLMLLGATTSGVVAGAQRGALAGFVFGFMFDLVLVSPFGLSPLVYGVAGFLAGYAQTFTVDPTWYLSSLFVAGSSALGVVMLAFASEFVGLEGEVQLAMLRTAVVVGIVNGLLAPSAMPVQRWCFRIKRALV